MVNQEQAKRLTRALAEEITYTAPPHLRNAINAGLYAPRDLAELEAVVWRALEVAELDEPTPRATTPSSRRRSSDLDES